MKKNGSLSRGVDPIVRKAGQALKKAVAEAIRDHARTGDPVVIWRNGKVVWVSARQLLRKKSSNKVPRATRDRC